MLESMLHICLGFIVLITPVITQLGGLFSGIYPGTNWCGPGNSSKNGNDLGREKQTDSCCRTHDHCPDYIEAGKTKYNLTNDAAYTKLSCACDLAFYKCLLSVGENEKSTANSIGNIYFNILGTQCFKKEYPIKRCIKYYQGAINRCQEYEYDETAPKKWQFFDVPLYNK